jgi:tryptophan-rich sensory protein
MPLLATSQVGYGVATPQAGRVYSASSGCGIYREEREDDVLGPMPEDDGGDTHMADFSAWYDRLAKPSWTPQPSVIGTIWTVVYPLIALAAVATVIKALRGDVPRMVLVALSVNLVANIAFTPIQFGMRNLPLATADIIVVLVTIIWWVILVWRPGSEWIAFVLAPYLIWVSTATVLQVSITLMNR